MSREDPIFRLRLPDPLKERLKVHAEENRRSLTQEIVERLERSLDDSTPPDKRLAVLEMEIETLRAELRSFGYRLKAIEEK